MIHTQTPEKLAQQQKLDRELAAVLMAISVTTRSIARNIHLLSMQRHVKGVNLKSAASSRSTGRTSCPALIRRSTKHS